LIEFVAMLIRKSRWRTWFGLRGELWYYAVIASPKIADRPHWLTIVIGLVSPTIGVVALLISLLSLRTSEQAVRISETNLKVGQRGYISLKNGRLGYIPLLQLLSPRLRLEPNDSGKDNNNDDKDPRLTLTPFGISYQVDVENLGNTPVRFHNLTWESSSDIPVVIDPPHNTDLPQELGQKSHSLWEFNVKVYLNEEGKRQLESFGHFKENYRGRRSAFRYISGFPMELRFRLYYIDVFNEDHSLNWCWGGMYDVKEDITYTTNCSPRH
jgi:hypothetical protein